MNNDPADNIMPRNDFSLTIIWLMWIAAAVATLHLMGLQRKGVQGRERGLPVNSILQEFKGFMVSVNVESNLYLGE